MMRAVRRSNIRFMAAPELPPCSYQPKPYNGPSYADMMASRKKYVYPSIVTFYKEPVLMVEGHKQYLFDHKGNRYLDMIGGIVTVSVGHSHPTVTEAIQEQCGKLIHTTSIYPTVEVGELSRELTETLPQPAAGDTDNEWVAWIVNTGSEANDLATLLARTYTGSYDLIVCRNGYHGASEGARGLTSLSTWKHAAPTGFGVRHTLTPNPYSGTFTGPDAADKYAADVLDVIKFATNGQPAAFFLESIQGVGGTVVPPKGYMQQAYNHVQSAGGLCIADEVQTGFGRTGKNYWGWQTVGENKCTPDIITMAKGMGNGFPVGGLLTRRKIANSLIGKLHFNTYGGNPLQCAVVRAVMKVIEQEELQKNCLVMGNRMVEGLNKLKAKHDCIGDVRGEGLMLGVEMVKSQASKEPATETANAIFEELKKINILSAKGGLYGNVLRVKPPMCITAEDVDFFVQGVDYVISTKL